MSGGGVTADFLAQDRRARIDAVVGAVCAALKREWGIEAEPVEGTDGEWFELKLPPSWKPAARQLPLLPFYLRIAEAMYPPDKSGDHFCVELTDDGDYEHWLADLEYNDLDAAGRYRFHFDDCPDLIAIDGIYRRIKDTEDDRAPGADLHDCEIRFRLSDADAPAAVAAEAVEDVRAMDAARRRWLRFTEETLREWGVWEGMGAWRAK